MRCGRSIASSVVVVATAPFLVIKRPGDLHQNEVSLIGYSLFQGMSLLFWAIYYIWPTSESAIALSTLQYQSTKILGHAQPRSANRRR